MSGVAAPAFADTIQGHVESIYHGLGANDRGGYGEIFWSGTGAAARFDTGASCAYTFCTDANFLNQSDIGPNYGQTYHLIRVTEAPFHATGNNQPNGQLYTHDQEVRLNAIALAAKCLGIVDGRGFITSAFTAGGDVKHGTHSSTSVSLTYGADSLSDTRADWIQGIQQAIWRELGGALANEAGSQTPAETFIENAANHYMSGPIVVRILGVDSGGLNNDQGQDQLVMLPIPPAAWAGLGGLGVVLGFGWIRNRRLTAE